MQFESVSMVTYIHKMGAGSPVGRRDRVSARYNRVCSDVGVEGFPAWYTKKDVIGHFLFNDAQLLLHVRGL